MSLFNNIMVCKIVIFCCVICISLSLDFEFNTYRSKLLTWMNSDAVQQKVLLSQLNIEEETLLVQRATLPYQYLLGEDCTVTQSFEQVIVYSPNFIKQISLEYLYMKGNQVISKNTIQFSSASTININDQYSIAVSLNSPNSVSNEPQTIQKLQVQNSLYLFHNQSLLQFDSSLFSSQSTCYMLSPMTPQLCKVQQCQSLPPTQLYNMQIGQLIKNFTLIDNHITLPIETTKNQTSQQVYCTFRSTNSSQYLPEVKEETVQISGSTIIKVNFELSQTNNNQVNSTSLRTNDPTSYNVKIILTNSQPVYAIKTIKRYTGQQVVLSEKVMFKPYQQIDYQTVWDSDQQQIPAVEIYNENLLLQSRYSMSNYIDLHYNQHFKLQNSNSDLIQSDHLQSITVSETHNQKFPLIIVVAASIGALLLLMFTLGFFRKRIFRKCYTTFEQTQDNKQEKKQIGLDQMQSAKQIRDNDEFTFEKKYSLFSLTPSITPFETQPTQQNLCTQNPQEQQNQNQSPIQKQLPKNYKGQTSKQKDQDDKSQAINDPLSRSNRSLSLNSNYSRNFNKKSLTKQNKQKETDEVQQTENV